MTMPVSTLLLVDDTPDTLQMLSDLLTEAGYRVLCAESGEMALISAQHGCPDLVMVDVRMPGMDGFETCRRLKEFVHMKDIPVLLTSAHVTGEVWKNALAAGGSDVIVKPFNNLEVLTRVRLHLLLRHLQRTVTSMPST